MFELIRGTRVEHDVRTLSLCGPAEERTASASEIWPIVSAPVRFTARDATDRQRRGLQLRSLFSVRPSQYGLYHDRRFQQSLDRVIQAEGIRLVQFEFSQMGSYRVSPNTPTILDVHNIEYDLVRQISRSGSTLRRIFNSVEYRKFKREEIDAWHRASCCVATSAIDARTIEQHTGRHVAVIPNGVDLDFFTATPLTAATPGLIVFVGAMRYRPNAEGAKFFVERVFPLVKREMPGATVAIVGADPPPTVRELGQMPGVTVTGTVDDVRPWLKAAQIVVVPLLHGGGTRLKILEAFATGRPVVSTRTGAEGIAARDGSEILIADDPVDFARAVVQLGTDEDRRSRLVNAALDLVREQYQWSKIGDALRIVQSNVVAERAEYLPVAQ
jgi:glycosyltransferase involved in cell wall biosynthesis